MSWLSGYIKKAAEIVSLILLVLSDKTVAQEDIVGLFSGDSILPIQLVYPFEQVYSRKKEPDFKTAALTIYFNSQPISDSITLRVRGEQRRKVCEKPSLLLNFRKSKHREVRKLKQLKLVCACSGSENARQWLLKEYLIYRMYQLLTPLSFKVRLVNAGHINSKDTTERYYHMGFLIENVDALAKRNNCTELNEGIATENTNRRQTTLVAVFQYMIGNTDWAVPVGKNIKLLLPADKPGAAPYIIPYDFDYSGMVNTDYAVPNPAYETETVKERIYRGFPRTPLEISMVIDTLQFYRSSMIQLIQQCEGLSEANKTAMTTYLDEFFVNTSSPGMQQKIFIKNARKE